MRVNNCVAARRATIGANRELPQKARPLRTKDATGQTKLPAQRATRAEDHQPILPLHQMSDDTGPNGTGLLLADLNLKPIYASNAATSILHYVDQPDATANHTTVQTRIRFILQIDRFIAECSPRDFLSGRRRYVCRSFLIESLADGHRPPLVALILERRPRDPFVLSDVGRRFHLSLREIETVQHLIHGLTTKEAAQRMNISPNTVKQFVRFIMNKMRVTTRSGIIGKLVGG
jgi:DNA-binding CsgD family transcriptional regulator